MMINTKKIFITCFIFVLYSCSTNDVTRSISSENRKFSCQNSFNKILNTRKNNISWNRLFLTKDSVLTKIEKRNISKIKVSSASAQNNVDFSDFSIMWYPRGNPRFPIGHNDLRINNNVFDFYKKIKLKRTFTEAINKTNRNRKVGFFLFNLSAPDELIKDLESFLLTHKGDVTNTTCVQGLCDSLEFSAIMNIPKVFRKTPTLLASYLVLQKKLGGHNIMSVEYVGNSLYKDIFSVSLLTEFILPVSSVGAFVFYIEDVQDKIKKVVVLVTKE